MENPYKRTGKESELETLAKSLYLPGYTLVNFNKLLDKDSKEGISRNLAYVLLGTWETIKVATYFGLGYTAYSIVDAFSNAF
ncbi:hypothetical protein HY494_02595 [Candidatus Woesearchaeota archaeon]|nr:hypothetical protein [Candidatus Woesearchaeota archaeon]